MLCVYVCDIQAKVSLLKGEEKGLNQLSKHSINHREEVEDIKPQI